MSAGGEVEGAVRLVLLGPPGAGKGTQARVLVEQFGTPHISTGDALRNAIRQGDDLGKAAQELVNAGKLVPDELVRGIVEGRLAGENCRDGFILDGYPRSLRQARDLDDILEAAGCPLERVVELSLGEDEIVRRLSGRRMCTGCGSVFHVVFNRPHREDICDGCGAELIQRDDDREDVIRERLRVYDETSAPLVKHYRERGLLVTVSAADAVEAVTRRIRQMLEPA